MEELESKGRTGEVMRTLAHGTVMIWDPIKRRAYPFYRAGHEVFKAREVVEFVTDKTDTIIIAVTRPSGPSRRRLKRIAVTDDAVAHRRAG